MKQLASTAQRLAMEEDREYLTKQLSNPLVQNIPLVRKSLRRVEHDIETQSPPILKGMELDKEVKLEKELREEIVPNMPSQEEMRKAPSGSIGRHQRFEKKYKEKILRWKNSRRTIYRESDDPDIANLEQYRPTVSQHNMHGALIQGQDFDFPSPQYKANYDGIDWSAHTRADGEDTETFKSRVRREEIAALRARLDALEEEITAPVVEPEPEETAEDKDAPTRLGLEEEN
jgi:hypothetical protein